ncbi:MAG: glycosyltransferase family 2 protein [Lachnospiraceae bacterium]|nr:glycosyltransferase family 2 protein [Lachnospiraceae bacterium]MDD3616535.1 glycosyltransferase family 2 protein [Lachnospiraceae bacterium]
MKKKRTVDVIIPAYKPEAEFEYLLEALSKQNYPIGHILVMNTEEEYWNPEWEEQYDNLEVYHIKKSQFDHGATRDEAAQMSLADILVFMTQDAVPANARLIESLVEAFDEYGVKAAYARQLPRDDCDPIEQYTRKFNYPPKNRLKDKRDLNVLGIKTFFCSNVCAAYDRTTYFQLGGFPRHAIFNEDMIFCGRLIQQGFAISYVANAAVIHSHNYGCIEQFHRNFDLAVSHADHPEIFKGVKTVGEGVKLVKNTAKYLCKHHKYIYLIPLFFRSGFKYLGYSLGKRYRTLPPWMVRACSMNRQYWNYKGE